MIANDGKSAWRDIDVGRGTSFRRVEFRVVAS